MTISTEAYYRWSRRKDWATPPFNGCSPNLDQILKYCVKTYGGRSLGCHNDRAVAGSNTMSTHAWGAALDYLPDGGNLELIQYVAPFLIQYSQELGVNTIHDYYRQRMWKPVTGWGTASIGNKGGQWGHIETTPAMFSVGTTVESRITLPSLPPPGINYNPDAHQYGLYPANTNKPGVGPGMGQTPGTEQYSGYCQYANDVMRVEAGQGEILKQGNPAVWTIYSMNACMNIQQFFGLPVNGWITLETWGVLDGLATNWGQPR